MFRFAFGAVAEEAPVELTVVDILRHQDAIMLMAVLVEGRVPESAGYFSLLNYRKR